MRRWTSVTKKISIPVRQVVLSCHASPEKPLDELEKVEITLTIDSGQEDLDVLSKCGRVALRRIHILRLINEALDQEGILTQEEDLSRALNVGIRTIKRDIAHLRKEGYLVREYLNLYGRYNLPEYQDRITEITGLTSPPIEYLLKKGELL